ncbi:probable carboxylesterase 18 [Vitis vinifera]|uniref:probable carboxylesterase 18 n=1 Tax=Vitis vinifera TaxID=29760 RepID=UPI0008FED4AE|nr:probable carboxylesterase 18 [Vitis vinifera]|eukprot:XP_019071786.1 PREDICTED: probable carboxylesterase 18 isoform X2 [Vitis vinifera]
MSGTSGSELRTSLKLPWRIRFILAALNAISNASIRRNGTVNRCLMTLIDFKVPPSDKPVKGVTTSDTTVDPSRNLWFRYFLPRGTTSGENLPIIVYFHGGSLVFLSPSSKSYDDLCRRLAGELPATVVSVNYRLAPEHKFPSPYEDGVEILKFIDENPPANADLTRCFIVGDSAGGNLVHHVTARAGEHDFRNLKIAGAILIQPFFGGEERTESEIQLAGTPLWSVERTDWCWKAFLPEGSDRDHPAANVFGPKSSDISGLKFPKSLVFMGGFDPLRDWQKRYCEGLKGNGKEVKVVDYPNAIHSFYIFPQLPESTLFLTELQDFIYSQ